MAAQRFTVTIGGQSQTVYNQEAVDKLLAAAVAPAVEVVQTSVLSPFSGTITFMRYGKFVQVSSSNLTVPASLAADTKLFNISGAWLPNSAYGAHFPSAPVLQTNGGGASYLVVADRAGSCIRTGWTGTAGLRVAGGGTFNLCYIGS